MINLSDIGDMSSCQYFTWPRRNFICQWKVPVIYKYIRPVSVIQHLYSFYKLLKSCQVLNLFKLKLPTLIL